MIEKKYKNLTMSLLLLTLVATNIRVCHAEHRVSFGTIGENTPMQDVPFKDWAELGNGNKKYEYTYKELVVTDDSFVFDIINSEGKSVIHDENNVATESFKAGTWAGINITETQSASWLVSDFKYREIKKKYTCHYEKKASTYPCEKTASMPESSCTGEFTPYYPGFQYGTCKYEGTCTSSADSKTKEYEKDFYENFECPATHPEYSNYKYVSVSHEEVIGTETTTSSISAEVEANAISSAQTKASNAVGASMGIVNYIKDNRYPDTIDKLGYAAISATPIGGRETSGWGTKQGSVAQKYEYKQDKVCMNVKTSEVVYRKSECNDLEGEITITNIKLSNNKTYWRYFIPLNTKTSNDNFFIQVVSNPDPAAKLYIGDCISVMDKYGTKYRDYIVPNAEAQEGMTNSFSGDYREDLAIIERNGGCHFSTTMRIPVIQKFYNEIGETNDKKLKGFNFYYKPIDINNPFPNGISETSLWKDWNESENQKPNLSDSYSTITYKALNINATSIRNYNNIDTNPKDGISDNLYTDWTKMNKDGTSKYIDNNNPIARNGILKVYKLGCGPTNENEYLDEENTIKNPLYQEWCDNS